MAGKLLHSLADDNPDLRKQIGCMTGIFNLFDRHNAITTKRISHKRLPPGHSQSNPGELVGTVHQEKPNESSLNENVNNKQSMPAESSRDSLSSCSSSLSSMDCNKTTQLEALSFSRTNIVESPSIGLPLDPLNTYNYSERHPFNIKHVVQDSMHREVRTSFVKMTDDDDFGYNVKHRDSPRPPPMSKCAEVSSRVARRHKQDVPIDIEESFRVLAKLKDASWNFNQATRCPTSACETEATHEKNLLSRDLRRLSYDGRERSQSSFESRNPKSSPKLKELPRLSLDSRETSACRNFQNTSGSTDESPDLHHSSGNQKRLPSVVAKLMGLETLPDTFSTADTQYCGETLTKSLESRKLKISASDKSLSKCPTSPRRKNHDLIRKPIQTSRLPVETAPWRKLDGTRVTKSIALRHVKSPGPSSTPAVHGEVEMKLKDLEFEQSSKDLRSLKKILEAIQSRALSEIENGERTSVFGIQRNQEPISSSPNQKTRLMSQRNRRSSVVVTSTSCAPNYSKAYEPPIIIMRPAKPVEKSVISTPVIQMDRFPVPHKLQNEGFEDNKKGSNNGETRARVPKSTQKKLAVITPEKKSISRNIRSPQTSSKPQLAPKERNKNSIKSSDSVSPRLRHGKFEVEKRSHPPKSDANKSKRRMKQTDSSSHCGKIKPTSSNIRQCDDPSSEMSNEPGILSYQSDDMTQRSDASLSLDSKMDVEVTSSTQSTEIDDSQQATETVELLTPCSVKKLSMVASSEDGSTVEQDAIALEHPSPVSVLDGSLYRDDEASPVKKITISLHGDESLDSIERRSEDQCNISDDIFVNPLVLNHNVEIDSMNFENIGDLIRKFGHLNSHHDEGEKDYNRLLCENTSPDHIYISEILLASGILLRDLGSDLTTFQLHPYGNPIDQELFFVLEKTKVGGLLPKEGFSPARASYSNREKFDRKLIFDAVNEILSEHLALIDGGSPEPWLKPTKIAKEAFSGQKILKHLCNEIEQFQAKKFRCNFDNMKDDSMSILQDDLMRQSRSWTNFQGDVYDVVLDVERSIFKDLVNEIIVW
ncbi:protein LONGIFOLIA 2 [Cucumis melo var. makuwa]|uniref:Protein LONGIFOLIA 2 n=2 Tax=Cucumis melo TaxID=3656 RepID=A0A1S3BVW9_CUCME|nr:protein LONGIFOLIA 2 [Cucumis melo]XP_050937024.1 protein LONGIFOLIA 2 [Cucumis melo]KAA0058000.1 protein LONGIFOLIA 2 [Cucumis melo var. makuwa]